jgi:hypothetical protein
MIILTLRAETAPFPQFVHLGIIITEWNQQVGYKEVTTLRGRYERHARIAKELVWVSGPYEFRSLHQNRRKHIATIAQLNSEFRLRPASSVSALGAQMTCDRASKTTSPAWPAPACSNACQRESGCPVRAAVSTARIAATAVLAWRRS